MRIVVDTNIIVSALLSEDGTAFQVLTDVMDGRYEVIVSVEIYNEYDDVLHRDRFGFEKETIEFILEWFRENAVWVEVNKSSIPMPDEKDRIFYDVARCCQAKLLTGNNKHYPVDEFVTSLWELK